MMQVETASAAAYGKPESQKTGADDLGRKQRYFRAYETNKQRELAEQRQARQYYNDKQWTDTETQRLNKRGQQATVRNRIKRKIDFLVGVEQRLRRDPKAYPRTPKHEQDADTATAALRYGCDINRWENVSSDAMRDGLISGIGVAFVGIERQDPKMFQVAVERYFYDPRSTRPDFSDARYQGLYLWMDIDEAKDKWPDKAPALESMMDAASSTSSVQHDIDREQQWADFEGRRIRVVEFWELRRWDGGMMGTTALTPAQSLATQAWYYCYFSGVTELESGWSPYKGEFGEPDCPYEAWSPYVDELGDRYGMVRTMKSIQDEINYSASKILHRIATDRFYYREGSVDDVDEFSASLARPDGKVKIQGEWNKEIGLIDANGMKIQGETERFQLAVQEIENLGPNPGLVGKGQGVDGASGRALLAQRDSGMTELSPIFERHRDWKLRVYRKLWQRCRQAWRGEKWIRITDDDSSVKHIALNQYEMQIDPMTGRPVLAGTNMLAQMDVDIILNEGPDTITVQEELLQTLAQVGEAATGPLGKVLIELSNAPNKERLLNLLDKATAPDPEVMAMQKRMAQLEAMLQAITIDEKRAGIENKRADTLQKLVTATTPQQQQTDEFGMPSGPPPAEPNLAAGFQAMQAFPIQFGRPLLEEITEQMDAGPPMPPDGGPGGPPPDQMGMPPMTGEPMMPPGGALPMQMPEQIAQPGALPVNPGA